MLPCGPSFSRPTRRGSPARRVGSAPPGSGPFPPRPCTGPGATARPRPAPRAPSRPRGAPAPIPPAPPPPSAGHVRDDLEGRVELILDGGPTPVGVESTVLDMTGEFPLLLRPGGVPLEALREALGPVRVVAGADHEAAGRSTGLRYRHYA